MSRRLLVPLMSLLFVTIAAAAFARSSGTTIIVTPDELKNGETKTFSENGRTITLRRDGDTIHVKIDGAGETKNLSITSADGDISINPDGKRRVIVLPDFEKFSTIPHVMPRMGRNQTWYVCPKDHATLRVPEAKENDTFKCPVDGTTMEKRKGHGFSLFFDDEFFKGEDL